MGFKIVYGTLVGDQTYLTKCKFKRENGKLITHFTSTGRPINFQDRNTAEECIKTLNLCNNISLQNLTVVKYDSK